MQMNSFKMLFLPHLSIEIREAWGSVPDLDETLGSLVVHCQSTWPTLSLSAERFLAHLAQHVRADTLPGTLTPHASDLYLALGAVICGDTGVCLINAHVLKAQLRLLRTKGLSAEASQEMLQALCVRLVIGTETSPPRLLSYSGSAPIVSWMRAVTLNFLHNERRRPGTQTLESADDDLLLRKLAPGSALSGAPSGDTERILEHRISKPIVQDALRAAVQQLDSEERLLLKLCYVDGLRLQQIAMLHAVDKSTISRHLASVRMRILHALRHELAQRLRLNESEADSMIRVVISQVELSLSGILAEPS